MKHKPSNIVKWCSAKPQSFIFFYTALAFVLLPLLSFKAYANDLWKALYSGRHLTLYWSFPSHAEFTFSPVVDTVVRDTYSWLGNLVFFGLHRIGGIVALQVVLRIGFVVFTVLLIHSIINYKVNPLILLLLFFVVIGIFQKLLLRTAIFLVPFMAVLWWLWYRAREKGEWRWLWGFPVLFLFWGNMHGSYIKGFCFLLLISTGDFFDIFIEKKHPGWPWLKRLFLIIGLVLLIITFVKPFPDYQVAGMLLRPVTSGEVGLLSETREQSFDEQNKNSVDVSEAKGAQIEVASDTVSSNKLSYYEQTKRFMQNLFIERAYERNMPAEFTFPFDRLRFVYVIPSFLIIFITLSSFIINYRAIRFRYFFAWLATAVLGMSYMRTVPLIVLVMIPVLFIKYQRGDFKKLKTGPIIQYVALLGYILIIVNFIHLFWNDNLNAALGSSLYRTGFGAHSRFVSEVPEYTRKHYAGQRGYNDYNTGTYLIWNWWPDKKVFVDSKSSAYRLDFINKYRSFPAKQLIEEYNLQHAILPLRNPSVYLYFIPHPNWKIEVMDQSFILFFEKEDARSLQPEEYLIEKDKKIDKLPEREKNNLKRLMDFISENQNNKELVGEYSSIQAWERKLEMTIVPAE